MIVKVCHVLLQKSAQLSMSHKGGSEFSALTAAFSVCIFGLHHIVLQRVSYSDMCRCAETVDMLVGQLEPSIAKAWDDGQQQAATELIRLANGCQQTQDAIVAAGAMPVLAAWLRSDHLWAQKEALTLLMLLLGNSQSNHDAFLATKAIPVLTSLLESEDAEVQGGAAKAVIGIISASQQNRNSFVAAGVLPGLANCCSSADRCRQTLAALICSVLVIKPPDGTVLVKIPGLIPGYVWMLRPDNHDLHEAAVSILAGLADTQHYADDIIALGALPLLIEILLSANTQSQLEAVRTLAFLAAGCQHHLTAVSDHISAAQALPTVLALLQSANCGHSSKRASLLLLRLLAEHLQPNRDSIVAAGLTPIFAACSLQLQYLKALQLGLRPTKMPLLPQALCLCSLPCLSQNRTMSTAWQPPLFISWCSTPTTVARRSLQPVLCLL